MIAKSIISKFRTTPYTEQELAQMPQNEALEVKLNSYEKAIEEIIIDERPVESIDRLKEKVLRECRKNHPTPIIVTMGNAFSDSFIVNAEYDKINPNAVFEMILYHIDSGRIQGDIIDSKEIKLIEEKLENVKKHFAIKRVLTAAEKEIVKDLLKNLPPDQNYSLSKKIIEMFAALSQGNLGERRRMTGVPLQDTIIHPVVPARKPLYNDPAKATVLCRIIGKDWDYVFRYKHYYKEFNNIDAEIYYIDNVLSPTGPPVEPRIHFHQDETRVDDSH